MNGARTGPPDLLESGTHVFSGTVRIWGNDYAELVTDSGVTIQLVTQAHPLLRDGERFTIVARKFRPLYQIEDVMPL